MFISFKKLLLVWLTLLLGLSSAICGGLFILFLAIVLWQVSVYAVGGLLGILSILFFIMARGALREAGKRLDWTSETSHLHGTDRLVSMVASHFDKTANRE
jgi:hypothetical protein